MTEISEQDFRSYIKICTLFGQSPTAIHETLQQHRPDSAPSYATVKRWAARFRSGRESIEDDPRSGRPMTSLSEVHVAAVRALWEEDAGISVDEVAERVNISYGSAHQILTTKLGLRSLNAKWVPQKLSATQKECRVETARYLVAKFRNLGNTGIHRVVTGDETWLLYDNPPKRRHAREWVAESGRRPSVPRPNLHGKKNLYSIFFSCNGLMAQIPGPDDRSVNGQYVVDRVLPAVVNSFGEKHPGEKMLLHWDNARPHHSAVVQGFLDDTDVRVLRHPPYSPDLAPCDFWLFSVLKNRLAGQSYKTLNGLGSGVYQCLQTVPKEAYKRCFESWNEKLQLCIDLEGEYL